MGDALGIVVRRERGFVVAAVAGEIDISTVAELREHLFEPADGGEPLIVDLEQITFVRLPGRRTGIRR